MKKTFFIWLLLIPLLGSGQIITTVAGNGYYTAIVGDGGQATAASIGLFGNVAIDDTGNFYFPDTYHERIRKVNGMTGIITTVAGNGISGFNGDGIPATAAELNDAGAVAFDSYGNLYIGDAYNYRVRKVDVFTGIISTFVGNGIDAYSPDGTPATTASILGGFFVFDSINNFYEGDVNYDTCFIRKIGSSEVLSTVGGAGPLGHSGDGGPATLAKLHVGLGIGVDPHGNIYLTDASASVRKINVSTGIITRVAGTGDTVSCPYSGDGGPATSAHISPDGVAFDGLGNMYIADYCNSMIEMVDTNGIIHSIAGTGINGFSGDNGPATAAQLNYPENLAIDPCGNIFVADFNNRRVRKITYQHNGHISLSGNAVMPIGSTVTVNANVANVSHNYSIKWFNKGMLFNTTIVPTVSYIKTMLIDSITAIVYGCNDSALSGLQIVADPGVNVSTVQLQPGIKLWPNPATTSLNISAANPISAITITNLLGQAVLYKQCATEKITIDIEQLPTGVYIVRVTDIDGNTLIKQLIKE